jgi:hypothetical protein
MIPKIFRNMVLGKFSAVIHNVQGSEKSVM